MGATSEMYSLLKKELSFSVNCLDWPKLKNERSFQEIAARIVAENSITENDVVGGSSLGGMIALEVSMLLDTKAVVLMGSALKKNEINSLLSMVSPLATFTPFSLIQAVAGKIENHISQMFAVSDPDFIRAMCRYILKWPGYQGDIDNIYRIHGEKDHIITCPMSGCEVIKNAGHLLVMTHVDECSNFFERINSHLTSWIDSTCSSRSISIQCSRSPVQSTGMLIVLGGLSQR